MGENVSYCIPLTDTCHEDMSLFCEERLAQRCQQYQCRSKLSAVRQSSPPNTLFSYLGQANFFFSIFWGQAIFMMLERRAATNLQSAPGGKFSSYATDDLCLNLKPPLHKHVGRCITAASTFASRSASVVKLICLRQVKKR